MRTGHGLDLARSMRHRWLGARSRSLPVFALSAILDAYAKPTRRHQPNPTPLSGISQNILKTDESDEIRTCMRVFGASSAIISRNVSVCLVLGSTVQLCACVCCPSLASLPHFGGKHANFRRCAFFHPQALGLSGQLYAHLRPRQRYMEGLRRPYTLFLGWRAHLSVSTRTRKWRGGAKRTC